MRGRAWGATVALVLAISLLGPLNPASAANGAPKGGGVSSPWQATIGDTYVGVHDDGGKSVGPNLWGTSRIVAPWCAVQPIRGVDVVQAARTQLDAQFARNAQNGVRRLNVTLGHPAAWVFNDAKSALTTKHVSIWFCQHNLANISFPKRKSLASGPLRDAYAAYVSAVIQASVNFLGASPANKLVLQGANEPNLGNGGQVKRKVTGAARSWKEASASMQEQERIMRVVAEQLIPGRYEISSPALYGKRNAASVAYLRAQSKHRTIDSLSVNFYTHNGGPAKALSSWRGKAARALKVVRSFKRLRGVPVWITETNYNLVNGKPNNLTNISSGWTDGVVQKHLAETTLAEAMRMGFAGIEFYQGGEAQVALKYYPETAALVSTRALFEVLAGRSLQKCVTKKSVITCWFSGRAIDGPLQLQWSTKGTAGVTVIGPEPLPPPPPAPEPVPVPEPVPAPTPPPAA